ncbi:MAG: NusG domain II-containing protein [Lachnospiraceae bacterium]|nr:NusG domain II-containing protein [Lachnospiraceae bacterium]
MKKIDWIIPGAAIAAALVWFTVQNFTAKEGKMVVVSIDGAVSGTFDLEKDDEIEIEGAYGIVDKLVIKDGKANMVEAGCPDKVCVNMPEISEVGETIVCLPGRIVVEITDGKESEYDSIAD